MAETGRRKTEKSDAGKTAPFLRPDTARKYVFYSLNVRRNRRAEAAG